MSPDDDGWQWTATELVPLAKIKDITGKGSDRQIK
jgi:hypothetical protein